MDKATEVILINCEREAASSIASEIDRAANGRSHVTERKNLDGSVADWIVLGTLAVNALPHILTYISKDVEMGTVRSIKVGDEIEITNPSPEDVEKLRDVWIAQHTR